MNIYSMEQRAKAIADVAEFGLAKAAELNGVPKTTIRSWCLDAGVETSPEDVRARTEAATAASRVNRNQRVEEAKGRMTLLLAIIAETAGRAEVEYIREGKASLSELVGARTRAIHDLQLLGGEATERYDVETVESIAELRDELRTRIGA